MNTKLVFLTCSFVLCSSIMAVQGKAKFDPTWESLDNRTNPAWFDESKVGIFVHWGVYSVPGFGSEWFWYNWQWDGGREEYKNFMTKNYPPRFTYQDFGPQFTAEFYDPNRWAELFKKAGAKYVVLTSKHHEGYALWPSKYAFSWNAMDVGPKKDLLGELATAIRSNTDLKFGLYHSKYEWFNPLWRADKDNEFRTNDFVQFKTLPELYEIVNTYKPDIVWPDGEWEAHSDYWKSKEFLVWLFTESPVKDTVVVNDRWGSDTRDKHGGFYTGQDRFNPGVLQPHKFENCMTLDKVSWGYRRNAQVSDYMTPEELMKEVVVTVSCGGNILVNVGPTKEGTIAPIQEERLLQMGEWLQINGEGIYNTVPWTSQNDTITSTVWYTSRPTLKKVYAFLLQWPGKQVQLGAVAPGIVKSIQMLGGPAGVNLDWMPAVPGIIVQMPNLADNRSKWSWTMAIDLL